MFKLGYRLLFSRCDGFSYKYYLGINNNGTYFLIQKTTYQTVQGQQINPLPTSYTFEKKCEVHEETTFPLATIVTIFRTHMVFQLPQPLDAEKNPLIFSVKFQSEEGCTENIQLQVEKDDLTPAYAQSEDKD